MERWRPCKVEGYIVSNLGLLMRLPYEGEMPKSGKRLYGGEPWPGVWDGKRYIVTVKRRTYKVARLICEAFHGPPPFPGAVCMHLDEDSRNNRADNLAWGTQRENMNFPKIKEWFRARTGENSTHAKARRKRLENAE